MSDTSCMFCDLIAQTDNRFLLANTTHWQIILANQQNYPGRCIVVLKRHAPSAGTLSPDEWQGLQRILSTLQSVITTKLGASHINFSCLMNGAYKPEHPNPHFHVHVIPRYRNPVTFGGMEFTDPTYGYHYTLSNDWSLSETGRMEIMALIGPDIRNALLPESD